MSLTSRAFVLVPRYFWGEGVVYMEGAELRGYYAMYIYTTRAAISGGMFMFSTNKGMVPLLLCCNDAPAQACLQFISGAQAGSVRGGVATQCVAFVTQKRW